MIKTDYIKCYCPPVNISHLTDYILVPKENAHEYTKGLYELGLGHKATSPQQEKEVQEFFIWKAKLSSHRTITRWIIKKLM